MAHRVCPWWVGFRLACPLSRRVQDPAAIVGPFIKERAVVLEPGPGLGFFTLVELESQPPIWHSQTALLVRTG